MQTILFCVGNHERSYGQVRKMEKALEGKGLNVDVTKSMQSLFEKKNSVSK